MKVKPRVQAYEVFHIENKDKLNNLNSWLNRHGWLMQIQVWQDSGYFRPEKFIRSNYYDEHFSIGQYVLLAPVLNSAGYHGILVVDDLKAFDTVED